jgi:hypothetical protein
LIPAISNRAALEIDDTIRTEIALIARFQAM